MCPLFPALSHGTGRQKAGTFLAILGKKHGKCIGNACVQFGFHFHVNCFVASHYPGDIALTHQEIRHIVQEAIKITRTRRYRRQKSGELKASTL